MKTYTLANLKGGSGKTTSTAYLAHAFHAMSLSVLVVDADPQKKTTKWAEQADWPMPVLWLPDPALHRKLPGITRGRGYDVVVIDTPPSHELPGRDQAEPVAHRLVVSAMRAADTVVVPMAPTLMELDSIAPDLAAIATAAAHRDSGPEVRVLFNRAKRNARSTKVIRRALESSGVHVLTAEIPSREPLAQSYTAPVTGHLFGYLSAAEELEKTA
jgi:chromosome partitioning protein